MTFRWLPAAAILAAGPVQAQDSGWTYTATLYGWLAGLSTDIATNRGTVSTELDFSQVLDDLQMAAFAAFEARNGRWGFIGDLAYTDLRSTRDTPRGILFRTASVDSTLTMFTGYAAYRAYETPSVAIDVAGGLRAYDLSLGVDVAGNVAPSLSYTTSESWVDAVVGARFTAPLNDRWYASGFFDVGGFGIGDSSDLTWQVAGYGGYAINDRWSALFGYRYFSVEKELAGRDTTLGISGPVIGVAARF